MQIKIVAVVSISLTLCAFSAIADDQQVQKLSIRAFQCQPFEYAELDAMPKDELIGAYCSYSIAADQASQRNTSNKEKYREQPRILAALLGDYVRLSEKCTQGMEKTLDILTRKHSAPTPDCVAVKAKFEAARNAAAARAKP